MTKVLVIDKATMTRLLREQPTFAERFLSHMLTRNLRVETDLVDHLFNSSEKRLARALLLLARFGDQVGSEQRLPNSQETLAEMVGTTRSRVSDRKTKIAFRLEEHIHREPHVSGYGSESEKRTVREERMPKPGLLDRASRRGGGPRITEMRSSVEGQITELCRDLAIEVKRVRQLELQADELRLAIREWVGHSERRARR